MSSRSLVCLKGFEESKLGQNWLKGLEYILECVYLLLQRSAMTSQGPPYGLLG